MLALFNKTVANSPDALTSPTTRSCGSELLYKFMSTHESPMCMRFDDVSSMAYTHAHQALLRPRSFASVDDIFCLFEGTLVNLAGLRQRYGLSKSINEVLLVIEAYRALRDRAPYPADQVVGDLSGQFAFILYDNKTRSIFVAADSDGKVPFFWGTTSDGSLAFGDDEWLIKECCGRSYAPFPEGCYFSSTEGLRSYEHPLKEVKAIPRLDSEGEVCGSAFAVDTEKNKAGFAPGINDLTAFGVV